MNFIKSLIKDKKKDRNFKKAGPGYTISDAPPVRHSAGPSQSSQRTQHQVPIVTAQRVAIANSTAEAAARRHQDGGKPESAHQKKIRELVSFFIPFQKFCIFRLESNWRQKWKLNERNSKA